MKPYEQLNSILNCRSFSFEFKFVSQLQFHDWTLAVHSGISFEFQLKFSFVYVFFLLLGSIQFGSSEFVENIFKQFNALSAFQSFILT